MAVAALATGVPTGVVPTPLYHRMTPVTWWDYPIWTLSAVALGLLAATFARGAFAPSGVAIRTSVGGALSAFAIGCPICNTPVVALVGISGAIDYWAALQPLVGLLSLGLLLATLVLRLRGLTACDGSRWRARAVPRR
jgi:hypothetical protein